MSSIPTAVTVRLPNHLGDACMSVPALDCLARHVALTVVGKPWAQDLFGAYPWPVVTLQGDGRAQRARLRAHWAADPARGRDALLLTNSWSSAWQLRRAGFRPRGYAADGRSLLLARAIPKPRTAADGPHMVVYYLDLVCQAFDLPPCAPPPALTLRVSKAAQTQARRLLTEAGVQMPYVVLCPVAVGLHHGKVKAWHAFDRLCTALLNRGVCVVAMPGPGEADAVRAALPGAVILPGAGVGIFAALLAGSQLVVANDSGSGHVAAAVGARLVSIFGVTDPRKTRPWGPTVTVLGGANGWPEYAVVEQAVQLALSNPSPNAIDSAMGLNST